MNTERLIELRDVVFPSIPPATLNMKRWQCGTSACLLGHAAMHPAFVAAGLRWGYAAFHVERSVPLPKTLEDFKNLSPRSGGLVPSFEDHNGYDAAMRFFGISYADADYLFGPDVEPTEISVRISNLLAENKVCQHAHI